MSQNATKSGTLLRYAVQTDPEVAALPTAPAFSIPRISFTQGSDRQTVPSQLVKEDKQESEPSTGTSNASGNLETEFIVGEGKHFEEAALQSRYRAPSASATATINIDASGSITDTNGTLTGGKLKVGVPVEITGFTNAENNGTYVPINIFGNKIHTISINSENTGKASIPETGVSVTVSAKGMGIYIPSSGYEYDTFTIEQHYSEIDVSRILVGMQVETINFGWSGPNAKVQKTVAFKGRKALPLMKNEGEYFQNVTPATKRGSIDTSRAILVLNGFRQCILESFNLQVGAPIDTTYGVMCDAVIGSSTGNIAATGSFVAVYRDSSVEEIYEAEQTVPALIITHDPQGNIKTFDLPNLKITKANAGDDQTVKLSCDYQAFRGEAREGHYDTTIAIYDTAMV